MNEPLEQPSGQIFGPVLTPGVTVPKSSYRAIYPDFARGAASLFMVAALPFFFAPVNTPQVARISVGVNYPIRTPQPPPIYASAPSVFWSTFTPAVVAAPTQWAPRYPDWLPPATRVAEGWYARPLREPDDIARLGWRGQQPAWNERRDSFPQGWFAKPPEAPDVTRLVWQPVYPTWIDRKQLVPQGWLVKPPEAPDVRTFQWRGQYPDRIARHDPFPHGWYAKPVNAPDVSGFQWRGEQPAWLPLARATQPQATVFDPLPRPVTIQLGWSATYPDWLPPLRLVPQGWWTGPTQNPQLVALSWSPEYPDFARSLRIVEPSVSYVQPVVVQVYGWDAIYPSQFPPRPVDPGWLALHPRPIVSFAWFQLPADVARSPVVLPGVSVRPLNEPPDIARYGWRPDYPDLLWAPRAAHFPSGLLDPFSRPPVLTVFGWYAIYPDWLPERRPVGAGLLVANIEPVIPVPPVAGKGGEVLGLAPKRTFSDQLILGGGGHLGG